MARQQMRVWTAAAATVVAWLLGAPAARAQIPVDPITGLPFSTGGVLLDAKGMISSRKVEENLAQTRARAKAAEDAAKRVDKADNLTYVSLSRLLVQAREVTQAGKPLTDDMRYLGGITQLRYVFVYPDDKDLVIAGPAEEVDASNPIQPVGKTTGRPVLQLEDLVVALRMMDSPQGRGFFGCSIDPQVDQVKASTDAVAKFGTKDRAALARHVADAIGPQKVSVIGTPPDTRMAFVMVAADYKMKRISLGLERAAAEGVGNSIDSSRAAANRFWFETAYEPLLVSPDGNAYAIRGKRLMVKAGQSQFNEKGATESAKTFARDFSDRMSGLAARDSLFADLQNIADMGLLAALIRQDKLDRKVGLDLGWTQTLKVTTVPVPRTAQTQVNLIGNTLASGGVAISVQPVVAKSARAPDDKNAITALRQKPAQGFMLRPAAAK